MHFDDSVARIGRTQSNVPTQREESVSRVRREPNLEAHRKYVQQGYVWV